jgi:hypothetical protein
MNNNNNGYYSPHSFDNALIGLEVHYASEGSLRIRIDENGSSYVMHVWKIPPPFELSRINGKMPQVESVNYTLDLKKSLVDKLLSAMSEIKIPAVPEYTTGLAGSTYILNINNGFNSSCYTWWDKPPKGYESLGRFVELLVEMSVENGRIRIK